LGLIDTLGKLALKLDELSKKGGIGHALLGALVGPNSVVVRAINEVKAALGQPPVSFRNTAFADEANVAYGIKPSTAAGPILPADARFNNPQGLTLNSQTLAALARIIAEGSKELPAGYTVEAISTSRPGARTASGGLSEHGFNRAIDIQIRDPQGKIVPGAMGAGGPIYDILDKAVLAAAERLAAGEAIASQRFPARSAAHCGAAGSGAAKNWADRARPLTHSRALGAPAPDPRRHGRRENSKCPASSSPPASMR